MNQVQTFTNHVFGELPVVIVDSVEWFGATEAAKSLSFTDPHKAITNHVDEEDSTVHPVGVQTGIKGDGTPAVQTVKKKFINESGLYSLIFGAAKQGNNQAIKEKAREYKRWVTSEVLPTIRKHGMYATDALLDDPDLLLKTITKLRDERAARLAAEAIITEQAPKVEYHDRILASNGALSVSQIAKDYGLSAELLNLILRAEDVQYRSGNQWLLKAKYHSLGYTKSETGINEHGRSYVNTKWTQAGRLFIHRLLESKGITAEYGPNEQGLAYIDAVKKGRSTVTPSVDVTKIIVRSRQSTTVYN